MEVIAAVENSNDVTGRVRASYSDHSWLRRLLTWAAWTVTFRDDKTRHTAPCVNCRMSRSAFLLSVKNKGNGRTVAQTNYSHQKSP